MIAFFRQLLHLIDRSQRWKLGVLMLGLAIRAGVEVIGIGSVAPFMSVAADPDAIESSRLLSFLYASGGFESTSSFLLALGLLVIGLLALSNAVAALTTWGLLRFSWGIHHRLAIRLYQAYLGQPYSRFTERNSSSFSKVILSEITDAIRGVLTPALNIASRFILVLAIAALLIALNPMFALVALLLIGGGYGGVYAIVRDRQQRIGKRRIQANENRFRIVSEAFGGIKEVKALGREEAFGTRFAAESWTYSRMTALSNAMALIPRYLFETLAFGGIIALMLYALAIEGNITRILPIVSVYAFAGYKMMPEVQNIFSLAATARFYMPALDAITEDLETAPEAEPEATSSIPFEHQIRFEGVGFQYPEDRGFSLLDVHFAIPKHTSVGFMGESGAGKTTLVDLLLGLHRPTEGQITVDGQPLAPENLKNWRRHIGYVPQGIFLSDDTIEANIAFGIPVTDINTERVREVASGAQIDDFIQSLPEGYKTVVGERGVRISGGQRQRIGIARALYHDPDLLLFDEATSALDYETETAVLETLNRLATSKTLIMVAHRLRTLERCDEVFILEKGRLRARGSEPVSSTLPLA